MSEATVAPMATALSGYELLADPQLNKGTAFSEEERDAFDLHGLLPPHVATLDEQVSRRLQALRGCETDLERYAFCASCRTPTRPYSTRAGRESEELLPIVYTPTVGAGCQQFGRLFPSRAASSSAFPHSRIDQILARTRVTTGARHRRERWRAHPGAGRPGRGRHGHPHRQAGALYRAGRHASRATCRSCSMSGPTTKLLNDPLYIGWRHERVRGQEYDDFVEAFVSAVISAGRRSCCSGKTSPEQCGALAGALSRPALHLQRRYPGHGRGRPARCWPR